MLPIPPLDGSKLLLAARVPMRVYHELAQYGFMLMMGVIMFTNLGRWMSQWSTAGAQAIFSMLQSGASLNSLFCNFPNILTV